MGALGTPRLHLRHPAEGFGDALIGVQLAAQMGRVNSDSHSHERQIKAWKRVEQHESRFGRCPRLLAKDFLPAHANEVFQVVPPVGQPSRKLHPLCSLIQLCWHQIQNVLCRVVGLKLLSQVGPNVLYEGKCALMKLAHCRAGSEAVFLLKLECSVVELLVELSALALALDS
eukprot:382034-Prymnesium_polylepis.1